jgi:hypothetical protein
MNRWDPKWRELPPVEPVDRTRGLEPIQFTEAEKARARRDYRFNHERHVHGREP